MNRKDLVSSLSTVFITKKEAKEAVDKIFVSIREALRKGDKVIISELGTFHPYIAKAKKGHKIIVAGPQGNFILEFKGKFKPKAAEINFKVI